MQKVSKAYVVYEGGNKSDYPYLTAVGSAALAAYVQRDLVDANKKLDGAYGIELYRPRADAADVLYLTFVKQGDEWFKHTPEGDGDTRTERVPTERYINKDTGTSHYRAFKCKGPSPDRATIANEAYLSSLSFVSLHQQVEHDIRERKDYTLECARIDIQTPTGTPITQYANHGNNRWTQWHVEGGEWVESSFTMPPGVDTAPPAFEPGSVSAETSIAFSLKRIADWLCTPVQTELRAEETTPPRDTIREVVREVIADDARAMRDILKS